MKEIIKSNNALEALGAKREREDEGLFKRLTACGWVSGLTPYDKTADNPQLSTAIGTPSAAGTSANVTKRKYAEEGGVGEAQESISKD